MPGFLSALAVFRPFSGISCYVFRRVFIKVLFLCWNCISHRDNAINGALQTFNVVLTQNRK